MENGIAFYETAPYHLPHVLAFAPNRAKAGSTNRTFTTETNEEMSAGRSAEKGSHLVDSASMVEEMRNKDNGFRKNRKEGGNEDF